MHAPGKRCLTLKLRNQLLFELSHLPREDFYPQSNKSSQVQIFIEKILSLVSKSIHSNGAIFLAILPIYFTKHPAAVDLFELIHGGRDGLGRR